jgi:hypothetical protein
MAITTRALLRWGARAILMAAALRAGAAQAQATNPLVRPPPPAVEATVPVAPMKVEVPPSAAPRGRSHHVLGLSLDAGLPDGASATVLYRPWKYVRFGGGMLYNYVGYGVLGSASVVPYFPIAPSLTLEVGHFFDANANARFPRFDDNLKPLLQRVGYTFVNAQLGLELGHPNWFVFFVRGGLSRVWLSSSDADKVAVTTSNGSKLTFQDPSVRLGIPNVKAGFMLFFY